MEKQVTLSDGSTVTIKKIALGKFGAILLIFEEAFDRLKNNFQNYPDISSMTKNDFVGLIPRLLSDALPEVDKALHIVADLPAEYELGLDEATDILIALVETNDIAKIYANVKKILALRINPTPVAQDPGLSANGSLAESMSSPANTVGPDAIS